MINRIKANNFKILEFVDINPKKGVTFVFGPNEAGKSTMMDIIETTLVGGKKILNPIRDNQKKAETEIELDDYIVKKVFTEKSVRLEVFDKEGNRQPGGLKLIERLINKIGFDPHEFSRLAPKDQRKMLLELLKIDFTDLDRQRQDLFDERRDIGAQGKMLPTYLPDQIKNMEEYHDKEPKSLNELNDKYNGEYQKKIKHNDNKMELERVNTELDRLLELKKNLEKAVSETTVMSDEELAKLKDEINSADDFNKLVHNAKEVKRNVDKKNELTSEYQARTKKIEAIDTHKQNVLKNAKMPLDGLAITDECVTYNERPFDQLSTSQRMKVSIAISLLLMDPEKEKIIMIREGNLLDDKSLEVVQEMAKANDCYFFIEMVLDTGAEAPKYGILIREGKVIAVDGEPVK